jgi:hypothetical protein
MLIGFETTEQIVGSRLNFDAIRLESDEEICPSDSTDGLEYSLSQDCTEDLLEVIEQYYEKRPEIRDFSSPGTSFSLRIHPDDAEVVAKKLASEIIIELSDPMQGFIPTEEREVTTETYEDIVSGAYDISLDTTWEELEDVEINVQQELASATPAGIESPSFTRASYNEYLTEFVFDPIIETNWSGAHAWLINLALRELRNGRYTSAAYGFEGARYGLTKGSHWEDHRCRALVNSGLESLRNLCMNHGKEGDPFGEISLHCSVENRDLIFFPNFVNEPTFVDPFYGFSTKAWIANILILIQAVAHVMEDPTISRREVDPFGTNLTNRNITFVLKIAQSLIEQDDIDRARGEEQEDHQKLQLIDFSEYSPDIALTRILDSNEFQIISYGVSEIEVSDGVVIEYDLLIKKGGEKYVARTLRSEDAKTSTIEELDTLVGETEVDVLIFYEQEVSGEVQEKVENCASVSAYYVDLVNERMRPVSSGYPNRFEDVTTEEEINNRLDELFQEAETAETTQEKGDSLEDLMELVFEKAVPDTEVRDTNVRTRVEEIDLRLHNKGRRFPWDNMGSPVLVECKNWSETAGVDVIYTIFGKTQMMSPSCKGAILVAWEGVSDSIDGRDGDQLIREIRQKDINLIVLDKEDLREIVETGDAQSVFEEKADELWAR